MTRRGLQKGVLYCDKPYGQQLYCNIVGWKAGWPGERLCHDTIFVS